MSDAPARADRVAPHAMLADYYANIDQRSGFVRQLFNRTAPDYDQINALFSLGTGGRYRRKALQRAGLAPGARVLDVAVGTGLVAREAQHLAGAGGSVIGIDLSENMLAVARRLPGLALIQGRAEALPVADASVDLVSMGYALRHVTDLVATFDEYRRVLRPGGGVLLLEIALPAGWLRRILVRAYLGEIVPLLCRCLRSGHQAGTLMRYYWDTIEACVAPQVILETLASCGFTDAACVTDLGMFRAYTACKPTA